MIPEGFVERLLEDILGRWCETIEQTRGIPAAEVWAAYSAHVDPAELAERVGAVIEERGLDRGGRERARLGDPDAGRECLEIQRAELIATLERHGGGAT